MFCPNCGNNCSDANFCPKCGTKLAQQTKQPTVWSVGQPCPHCGGTKLEGNNCAFCGAQLMVDIPKKKTVALSSDIPCGFYKGANGSLTLYEKECIVCNNGIFRKHETRIPYEKITTVIYVSPRQISYSAGHLLFRWEGNKDEPIGIDHNYARDKTTVATNAYPDWTFYHIYYMLKAIVPNTAEFRMIKTPLNAAEVDALSKKVDVDEYFDRYAPFRSPAVDEVCKRTGAERNIASLLIDRVFDARQEELYEAEPMAAVLDANLIIGKKTEQEEKVRKELAERRQRFRRDRALYNLERMAKENIRRK